MTQAKKRCVKKGYKGDRAWIFPLSVAAVYPVLFALSPEKTFQALKTVGSVLGQAVLPLMLAFVMMFILNRWVTPARVSTLFGRNSGLKGASLSTMAGVLSMGPVYAWYPFLKALRNKGASDFHLANFISNRAVKPALLPLMIFYFGWTFSLILTALSLAGALLTAAVVSRMGRYF